ncbi:MAG: DnaD domain-containing protein [Dehalococcoidia bacterium]
MPDRQLASSQGQTSPIPVPESFFTGVVPGVQDLAELKLALHVMYVVARRSAGARPDSGGVGYEELKAELRRLSTGLDEGMLNRALDLAVQHGAILRSTVNRGGVREHVYSVPALVYVSHEPAKVNVFALYEQNIGMITPLIAEELKEAERLYPAQWLEEAFKEAVALNKRSWRYIARILERWAREGKDSGEHKRDIEKDGPDKYVKGRYGHLVKR